MDSSDQLPMEPNNEDPKDDNDQELPMEPNSEDPKDDNDQEAEVALVEKAYCYLTNKTYPASCTKNDKRSIRRKSEKLVVKDGVLYFKKKDGSEVRVAAVIYCMYVQTAIC